MFSKILSFILVDSNEAIEAPEPNEAPEAPEPNEAEAVEEKGPNEEAMSELNADDSPRAKEEKVAKEADFKLKAEAFAMWVEMFQKKKEKKQREADKLAWLKKLPMGTLIGFVYDKGTREGEWRSGSLVGWDQGKFGELMLLNEGKKDRKYYPQHITSTIDIEAFKEKMHMICKSTKERNSENEIAVALAKTRRTDFIEETQGGTRCNVVIDWSLVEKNASPKKAEDASPKKAEDASPKNDEEGGPNYPIQHWKDEATRFQRLWNQSIATSRNLYTEKANMEAKSDKLEDTIKHMKYQTDLLKNQLEKKEAQLQEVEDENKKLKEKIAKLEEKAAKKQKKDRTVSGQKLYIETCQLSDNIL